VFVLLDSRARQRGYGRAFLDALPPCSRRVVSTEALPEAASRFLRQVPVEDLRPDARRVGLTETNETGGGDG
jgi:hypothetical protein